MGNSRFTDEEKWDIINKVKSTEEFARIFNTNRINIIALRSTWKKQRHIITAGDRHLFKYNKLKPSTDYIIAPAK